jgi:hypothetical protein
MKTAFRRHGLLSFWLRQLGGLSPQHHAAESNRFSPKRAKEARLEKAPAHARGGSGEMALTPGGNAQHRPGSPVLHQLGRLMSFFKRGKFPLARSSAAVARVEGCSRPGPSARSSAVPPNAGSPSPQYSMTIMDVGSAPRHLARMRPRLQVAQAVRLQTWGPPVF